MLAVLSDLALRRPWLLLGANAAALAVVVGLAIGAPERLAVGSLALDERARAPDIVLATRGDAPVSSRVYRVALQVIASRVAADPAVDDVRRAGVSRNERSTALEVFLGEDDAGDRRAAIERIEAAIDPGPLRVLAGGEARAHIDARSALSDDLWRLELLALPLILLVLAATLGLRHGAATVLAAALAIAGALAVLRLLDGVFDLSLLGIAPAAALGLALGVELPSMIVARFRDEAVLAEPPEALRRAVIDGGHQAAVAARAAALVPFALLVTPLDQALSIAIACALAAAFALAGALTATPALISRAMPSRRGRRIPWRLAEEGHASRAIRFAPAFLARSRIRTVVGCLIAVAALLALAFPALDGDSRPFSAADLPADSEARRAATVVSGLGERGERGRGLEVPEATPRDSHFGDLPPAAGIAAGLLVLLLALSTARLRTAPLALAALLPAAAGAGLVVLVFQEGHLAGAIAQERQGAVDTGALASLVAALTSICAARSMAAAIATRDERRIGMPPEGAAGAAAPLVLPAAIAGTVITGAATGVLAGSDLYAAREFGLAVAAGLVCDLVLVRAPFLAAAARLSGR